MMCRLLSSWQAPGGRWRKSQPRGMGVQRREAQGVEREGGCGAHQASSSRTCSRTGRRAAADSWEPGARTTSCGRRTAKTTTRAEQSHRPLSVRDYLEACSHNFWAKRKPFLLCSVYTWGEATGRLESNSACPCWPSWCPWPWRASPSLLTQPTSPNKVWSLPVSPDSSPVWPPSLALSLWLCGVSFHPLNCAISCPFWTFRFGTGSGTPFPQPVYYSDSHHRSGFCINTAFSVFLAHQSQWHRTNTGEKTSRSEMWWRLKGST